MTMTPTPPNTAEAKAVQDLAYLAHEHETLDPNELYSVVLPEGASQDVLDLECFLDAPERHRGTTVLHDVDSFVRFVSYHEHDATRVYADRDHAVFCAVFNGATQARPGWADHWARLQLSTTPEWKHWASQDRQMMSQEVFAEHIEDGLAEIVEPVAADVLELAQTFHANTGVAFKSSSILASGERRLVYEETTTAKAGQKGDITVPGTFTLAIVPYEGSDRYKITARFRHRASGGVLKLGYILDRPHDVLRAAFNDSLGKIEEAVTSEVLSGEPPRGVGR